MSFADLRGELLNGVIVDDPSTSLEADDNIQLSWTKRINEAEAQFWEANSGDRVDDSTEILGFECGGSQWVLETVRIALHFTLRCRWLTFIVHL